MARRDASVDFKVNAELGVVVLGLASFVSGMLAAVKAWMQKSCISALRDSNFQDCIDSILPARKLRTAWNKVQTLKAGACSPTVLTVPLLRKEP